MVATKNLIMNKLIEYRDYYVQIQDSAVQQSAFKEGFNTAIDLDLIGNYLNWIFSTNGIDYLKKYEGKYKELPEKEALLIVMEDAYKHWINNVFKPQYK